MIGMNHYISTTQAAKILKVTPVTIFNMIQDGRIKAVKVGRNYIIDKATLQENFIKDIKKAILPILKKHGIKKAAIFGSVVRGKKRPGDVDLLVEMEKGSDLFDMVALRRTLEEEIKMKVDLGTFDAIYPLLKEPILNSAVGIL